MSDRADSVDPAALTEQYKTDANLSARQRLYRYAAGAPTPPWFTWAFDQLIAEAPADGARILEVGCGNAALWQTNRPRVPMGWHLTLTDLSPGMVDGARRALVNARSDQFWFVRADVRALPFADASFDLVLANHMLYHVPERDRALGEIRRVLRPGGRLLASTNSEHHLASLKVLIDRFVPWREVQAEMTGRGETFWLENGVAQLAGHFDQIDTRTPGPVELRITDAGVVLDYVLSIERAKIVMTDAKIRAMRHLVAGEIAAHGAFRVQTLAGMLVAR